MSHPGETDVVKIVEDIRDEIARRRERTAGMRSR